MNTIEDKLAINQQTEESIKQAMIEYMKRPLAKGPKRITADIVAAEEYWFPKNKIK